MNAASCAERSGLAPSGAAGDRAGSGRPAPVRLRRSLSARDHVFQALLALAVAATVAYLAWNAATNLAQGGMSAGFGFLADAASFDLGDNPAGFRPGDSVLRAFAAGIGSTLLVSLASIAAATVLGTAIGIARLSANVLLAALARLYVECIRNIPLLLQILLWHAAVTRSMPNPSGAYHPLPGLFLSNRGANLPSLGLSGPSAWMAIAALAWLAVWLAVWLVAGRQGLAARPVLRRPGIRAALGLAPVIAFLLSVLCGAAVDFPEQARFGFRGGASVSPEYVAVFMGLTIYSAAFIAETVRSGILAVARGQREAAFSLGLRPLRIMWLIVLPQALRVMVPPMGSQYLSLVKNSSLGVVVGYPEAIRVATIVTSETGHAIEVIGIVMAVYLTASLTISAVTNLVNRSILARS